MNEYRPWVYAENDYVVGFCPEAMHLELGLRWLNDHGMRRQTLGSFLGEFFAGAVGAFTPDEDVINCLELGLRWLHDRASCCQYCGSTNIPGCCSRGHCY